MGRWLRVVLGCVLLGVAPSVVWAQVSVAAAEQLLRRSGVWSQLEEFPRHFEQGMREFGAGTGLTAQDYERLRGAAAESFSTDKLRNGVLRSVAFNINAKDHAELLRWYGSGTGQLVTGLDISATHAVSDLNTMLAEGNAALAAAGPQRQALLQQLVQASKVAEAQVNAMIHTAVGVYRGIASVTRASNAPVPAEFQRNMERQRPQMLAAATGTNAALMAAAYATLSDQELAAYLAFLQSRAGKRWVDVANTALSNTMDQCAQDFGRRVARLKPAASL